MTEHRDWPIVVGGCHRSGTSLVRRLLDAHPQIHCGPELGFFRDFFGDFEDDPLAHLRFAHTVRSILSEDDALSVLGRALVDAHERAAARAGKQRWADKSPENVVYLDAWERVLGDRFLVVHVVRNPLDTVASMRDRFPLTLPRGLDEQAEHYRRYVDAGLRFGVAEPERYVRVVYEELCSSAQDALERLMRRLGANLDQRQLAFNEIPHEPGLEDPEIAATDGVRAWSPGRWRSVLSADEARLVLGVTRDVWHRCDPEGRFIQDDSFGGV